MATWAVAQSERGRMSEPSCAGKIELALGFLQCCTSQLKGPECLEARTWRLNLGQKLHSLSSRSIGRLAKEFSVHSRNAQVKEVASEIKVLNL